MIRRTWAVAALAALAATLLSAAPASATAFKPYSIVICAPGETCTAPPSASSAVGSAIVPPSAGDQTMTATLTNENKLGTGKQVGSANLTPPAGFTVNSATYPECSTCTATIVGNVVELRNLNLIPGATVVLSMSVSTPSSGYTTTSAPASPWTIVAKQCNDFNGAGNDLTVDASTSTLTTVLGELQFNTEPADASLTAPISTGPYGTGGPITVGAADLSGNPITWFAGTVTIALNPQSGDLGGDDSAAAGSGGVASFGDLTVGATGYNYALLASSPNVGGGTSSTFNVYGQGTATSCGSGGCNGSLTQTGSTSQTTQVLSRSISGELTIALDNGVGYWTGAPIFGDCGNYTPMGPDTATLELAGGNAPETVADTISMWVSRNWGFQTLVANQQMCFAATNDFVSKSGNPLNNNLAYPATLPDGQQGFVGLLSDCSAVSSTTEPCITIRTGSCKDQIGSLEIVATVPSTFADDPLRSH